MRIISATLIFAILLSFSACQKEPASKPVSFKETEYIFLAPFDSNGKPSNLQKDNISQQMLSFIADTLPEKKDLRGTALLTSNPTTDIRITQRSSISVTFVSQGTGSANAIAFYTYPTSTPPTQPKDIKRITYIFPHIGMGSPLVSGDKVNIGTFDPGVSIGFVLLQNAWKASTQKLNNEAVHFCYSDALNPEVDPNLKKHVVLINYAPENKVLVGFEDLDRTTAECDHDFNDVVMYATIDK
jgi:hypothetical protein